MMGKIMRCDEITQARYLRLVCLYWNKECNLSYEDAEIEIDQNHLEILIKKKIVKVMDDFIFIEFLDEQMEGISETSAKRRAAVKKRWDKVKQNQTKVLQSDTSVLQSDTEKSRVEESRVEKSIKQKEFDKFWELYGKKVGDKKKCESKFSKLSKTDKDKIFATLPNFLKSIKDKQFQPHPYTYLNNNRWNDELKSEVKKTYSINNY
jgi:hypothetical protein